jgi:hypothetical protein
MKKFLIAILPLALIAAAVVLTSYANTEKSTWHRIKNPETVQKLKQFVAWKKAEAYADTNGVTPEIQTMFHEAERGDWLALSNSVQEINWRIDNWQGERHWHGVRFAAKDFMRAVARKATGKPDYEMPPYMRGPCGGAIMEVYRAFSAFLNGDEAYSAKFGREIIGSIPPGSIYFGGTDPGLFIVTVMSKSQPDGEPFFTVAQKSLADDPYRAHLLAIYGKEICVPTAADARRCFEEFTADLERRAARDPTSSGQVPAMNINGLLCKFIFDKNTNRDFFVEEAYPLQWMQPNLEPHGLIFKLNREPMGKLSDEILQRDHDFWTNEIRPVIGGWLRDETSLKEVAAFVEKAFGRSDLNGFTGDTNFIRNAYTQSMFSKSRSAIAGLYDWRAQHVNDTAEKNRMACAADFAFRQAWALCPYSPEAVYRFVNFLLSQNRVEDALYVAETAAALPQNKDNEQMAQLPAQLRQWQSEHPPAPGK